MKKSKKLIIVTIIAILLELFVFNFRFFLINFSNLEKKTINNVEIVAEEEQNNNFNVYKQYKIKIDQEIDSVKLNFNKVSDKNIRIALNFTDEGEKFATKDYATIDYNKKNKNCEYCFINSQKKCLEISLAMESREDFELSGIELNTWYYEFNWIRVFAIILIATILIFWKEINNFFNARKKIQIIIYVIAIATLGIICGSYCIKYPIKQSRFYEFLETRIEVDAYNLLTESILNGRIDLNYKYKGSPVKQKDINDLQNLDNYKDMSERREKQVVHYYDLAFYNGKYYCYFGIVPVITVMLPLALITGLIPYSSIPCLIYAIVTMIMFLLIYFEILKRLNIKFGFIFEFILYITLFFTTGIPYLLTHPTMYEAAQLSGIAWGMIGVYSLLRLSNKNGTLWKLALAGLSFGLMVCSRSLYVIYFPIFLILSYKYLIENKKINIKNCLYFAVPIVVLAISQMIYNYVRFDNVFEFGQFYQLTINDPSLQKMDIGMSISGILAYLFTCPEISSVYPFVKTAFSRVANGNLIFELKICGLIFYPFLCIMFAGGKLLKNNKQLKILWVTIIAITLIALSVNTCLAGVNQRYDVDIQPCLTLMSLCLWGFYLKKYNFDRRSKWLVIILSIISCFVAICIDAPKIAFELMGIYDIKMPYIIEHALKFYL